MSLDYGKVVYDDKERFGKWVASQVSQDGSWGDYYALGVVKEGRVTAGVVINNYNGANATVHIAITEPNRMLIPLFKSVCDYAFNVCKLKRITGLVPTNEPDTIKFDKHLGFVEEYIMKDGAPNADMMVLVLWPKNCRWLQES
jgi:hypothetical protein